MGILPSSTRKSCRRASFKRYFQLGNNKNLLLVINKEVKDKMGIHHVVLTVVNLQETERFYTKIFGEPEFADAHFLFYKVGSSLLILNEKPQKNPISGKFDPTAIGLE